MSSILAAKNIYEALHPEVRSFLSKPHGHIINGEIVTDSDADPTPVVDPGTGTLLCHVPTGSKETVDSAVTAARTALEEGPWARLSGSERSKLMWRLADMIEERADFFGQL